MNRLESLRDIPEAAWTELPGKERVARAVPKAAATPTWFLWRAVRATFSHPGRAVLMFRMALTYLAVSILARLVSLPRAFGWISPRLRAGAPNEARARDVVNALDTLLLAEVPFIRPQCWRRAAVLHRFLRFEGIDTTIVFGVTTQGTAAVEAHAWVERDGKPFAESAPAQAYRRVFEFTGPSVGS